MTETVTQKKGHNTLALLPLKNAVILPKSIIPIIVGRQCSINAIEHALKHGKSVFVTTQKDQDVQNPTIDDVHAYGTRATILQVMRTQKGGIKVLIEGISRAKIVQTHENDEFLHVTCKDIPAKHTRKTIENTALWRQLLATYNTYAQLNGKVSQETLTMLQTIDDFDSGADTIAMHSNLSIDQRQEILKVADITKRLLKLCTLLQKEIDILKTEEKIRNRVQDQVEKNQREYYLNEQLKAINKELGRDDQQSELARLQKKIKKIHLPKEAHEHVMRELKRLEHMPPLSSEAVVVKNYIDWIVNLPWHTTTKDTVSIEQAEKLLNKKHAHLKKPKERILEFLAAKKYAKNLKKSPIICLVGPPGVGKTSLGVSIAESLGRKLERISLGGIRDEAEIRGHRRTYIGALPGKIIQALRRAKTKNPVILLDEIDKLSSDMYGDPASALLEVLDPEQNKTFHDNFLELEYDLSDVMFVATANHMEGIPYPLFDRMEIIELSGYTDEEKQAIAQKFLIPKNLKEYKLTTQACKITSETLNLLIEQYTKESGVRTLEKLLTKLMRKAIQKLLKKPDQKSVRITPSVAQQWLGPAPYARSKFDTKQHKVGVATGLAWTQVGGDILEIESAVMPGKKGLMLTGQLGDVMQESAQAALTYIRSRSQELGLNENFSEEKDIHIHIPEGATPKDGPSAGITMCTALVSALTKAPLNPKVAMTGEITLRGRVLPVGGLKEKLLAAQQNGLTTILVPHENKPAIEEFCEELNDNVTVHYVSTMDDVIQHAFVTNPLELKAGVESKKH